jgi:hypothetical protein
LNARYLHRSRGGLYVGNSGGWRSRLGGVVYRPSVAAAASTGDGPSLWRGRIGSHDIASGRSHLQAVAGTTSTISGPVLDSAIAILNFSLTISSGLTLFSFCLFLLDYLPFFFHSSALFGLFLLTAAFSRTSSTALFRLGIRFCLGGLCFCSLFGGRRSRSNSRGYTTFGPTGFRIGSRGANIVIVVLAAARHFRIRSLVLL